MGFIAIVVGYMNKMVGVIKSLSQLNKYLQTNPILILLAVIVTGVVSFLTHRQQYIASAKHKREIIDAVIQTQSYNQVHLNRINEEFCRQNYNTACYTLLVAVINENTMIIPSALRYINFLNDEQQKISEQIDVAKFSQLNCEKANCDQTFINVQDYQWLTDKLPNKHNIIKLTLKEVQEHQSFYLTKELKDKRIYGYILYPIYFNNIVLYYVGLAVGNDLFEKNSSYYQNLQYIAINIEQNVDKLNLL